MYKIVIVVWSYYMKRQGHRNKFKSGRAKRGVWGLYTQRGFKGHSPLVGVGGTAPEASAFSKMRLEFVQKVDGTIITKLLIKSFFLFLS